MAIWGSQALLVTIFRIIYLFICMYIEVQDLDDSFPS